MNTKFVCGQDIKVSEPIETNFFNDYEVVGKVKGTIYFYHLRDRTAHFTALDDTLAIRSKKSYALDSRQAEVMGFVAQEAGFSMLYHVPSGEKRSLKVLIFNEKAIPVDTLILGNGLRPEGRDAWAFSDNKKFIAVASPNGLSTGRFVLFGVNLKEQETLAPVLLNLPEGWAARHYEQVLIDNEGKAFVIFRRVQRRGGKSKTATDILLVAYDFTNNSTQSHTLKVPFFQLTDVVFRVDPLNNSVVGGGLFTNKRSDVSHGAVLLTCPYTAQSISGVTPFPYRFEDSLLVMLSGRQKRLQAGVPNLVLRDLVLRKDGGALLMVEQERQYQHRAGSMINDNMLNLFFDYYLDDILLLSFEPKGDLQWRSVLRKRQFSQNDDAISSSYMLVKTRSALRFVFNDEARVGTAVMQYIVDGNGKAERRALTETKGKSLLIQMRLGLQTEAGAFVAPSLFRGTLRLVKIALD